MDADGIEFIRYVKELSKEHYNDALGYINRDRNKEPDTEIKLSSEEYDRDKRRRTIIFSFYKTMPLVELYNLMDQMKDRFGECFIKEPDKSLLISGDLYTFAIEYHSIIHDWGRIK